MQVIHAYTTSSDSPNQPSTFFLTVQEPGEVPFPDLLMTVLLCSHVSFLMYMNLLSPLPHFIMMVPLSLTNVYHNFILNISSSRIITLAVKVSAFPSRSRRHKHTVQNNVFSDKDKCTPLLSGVFSLHSQTVFQVKTQKLSFTEPVKIALSSQNMDC